MKSDPATRRARNVVLLVIATVALPSLVLTALGVAAIRNEEEATKQRIEKLYRPLLIEMAQAFNKRFDRVVDDAEPALRDLIAWSRNPNDNLTRYRAFVDRNPEVTNFFVLDEGGEALRPRFNDPGSDCCTMSACLDIDQLSVMQAARTGCSENSRQAQLTILMSNACAAAAWTDDETLRVARYVFDAPPPKSFQDRARYLGRVVALTSHLTDPTRPHNPVWAQRVARALMFRLESLPGDERRTVAGILAAQAERSDLMEALRRVVRTKTEDVVVTGVQAGGLRRLVVMLSDGDRTAGFELVSSAFDPVMDQLLIDRDLDGMLISHVGPYDIPKWYKHYLFPEYATVSQAEAKEKIIAWVLSSRSNLSWAFELVLKDVSLAGSLGRSRSGLFLWALILVGIALVSGIVYTVRSVILEARLSRLKTDFVSSVSHDLRTPLTSIRMFSETLRAGRYESDAERHEFLQIIIDEAERLSRLTERILDFSRMEAGKKCYRRQPTDAAGLVQHALRASKPMIDKAEFDVEVDIEDSLPPVEVDRDAMLEVLINLYSNAIKYSPDNRWMAVQVSSSSDTVCIRVRDQGIGIRRADQVRIFDKFYRVDTRRSAEVGGSGIGLSLVKHIVENHGGTVTVHSAPGVGSTFEVRLPLLSPSPVP